MWTKCCVLLIVVAVPMLTQADDEKGWLGVQIKLENQKIIIVATQGDSPAEKAKLQENDIIKKVGDFEPTTLQDFVKDIGDRKPGDKVTLVIERDGKEMKVEIKLGKRPDGT